jgi:hypothetical protein
MPGKSFDDWNTRLRPGPDISSDTGASHFFSSLDVIYARK